MLQPHLEQDAPLARVAKEASLPFRTAQRWVNRYRRYGLIGLTRAGRSDQGKRHFAEDLLRLAEGLALQRPPFGPATVYREVCRIAQARGEQPPGSYDLQSDPRHPRRFEDPRSERRKGLSRSLRLGSSA